MKDLRALKEKNSAKQQFLSKDNDRDETLSNHVKNNKKVLKCTFNNRILLNLHRIR